MITTYYPPYGFGGDATYVRGLTHALARCGHHVSVIHDRDAYDFAAHGVEKEPLPEPEGVEVHGLRSRRPGLACLATHQFGTPVVHGRRIAEILSQGFDVIHFHNISLIGGPGLLSLGDGLKIYTTHEHWLVCPSHILWRHNRELCTGKQCLRCVALHGRPPQLWRSTDLLNRHCREVDAFTTLSHACAARHAEFGFEFPMHVMAPFIADQDDDSDALPPSPLPNRPYCLFVGRLELVKGLQDVIPAFRDDGPLELWIAGKGAYESELKRLAAGSRSVRFLGHQSHDALRRLYRNARVVVMPSLCYEVFPMVTLEAFREGTPILARNRGPYPEIIDQSGGGVLFDSQADLESALHRIASDDGFRCDLSRRAKAAFERNWTESAGLDRYFALVRRIAHERDKKDLVRALEADAVSCAR